MSGPFTTRIVLAVTAGALLTATCNNKRHGTDGTEAPPVEKVTHTLTEAPPDAVPGKEPSHPTPCPAPLASASPLGPAVGPACPGESPSPSSAATAALEEVTSELGTGIEPVGPAMGATVGPEKVVVGSVILQGPPFCYVAVSACADGIEAQVTLSPAGEKGQKLDIETKREQLCLHATATYNVMLGAPEPGAQCAVRIYGD